MADNSPPDYKQRLKRLEERYDQEKAQRKEEESKLKQEEEKRKQELDRRRQPEERNRQTSFTELLQHCHSLLSPGQESRRRLAQPLAKYSFPPEILPDSIRILGGLSQAAAWDLRVRLSISGVELRTSATQFFRKPLSSEQDLEADERFGVEEHVQDIITELCKLPAARDEFGLGDGIRFSNHTNSLSRSEPLETDPNELSSILRPRPDQFCIHRVDDHTNTILTTVDYKPPRKLPVATLRMGLRPMDLWKEMVRSYQIPTDPDAKLRYNATRLVCSAIVQEYQVMVQEGLNTLI